MRILTYSKIISLAALLALLAPGCAVNPVSGKMNFVTMSEDQEIKLGKNYHAEILKQYGVYKHEPLQEYVSKIGTELAGKSHRSNLIYRFTVLDSPEVNAFALPGGYIYITRGILVYLNSEAEMAGVLGHEIGHVTARHGVRQQSAATAAQILSTVVAVSTGNRMYTDLSSIFGGALLSGYGREHELEADRLGAEYISNIGFNPKEMLEVVGVLKDQEEFAKQRAKAEGEEDRSYHGVFASHPRNDQRLQEVISSVKKHTAETTRNANTKTYLQQLDGLIFGDNPEHGIVRQNKFLHTDLGIAFSLPNDWRSENRPDRLILQSPDKQALQQVSVDDLNKHETPKEYMYRVLDNPKPQREETLTIDGLPAYSLVQKTQMANSSATARYTVIFHRQKAYMLIGAVSQKADFNAYDAEFLKLARSFHSITAAERKLAQPYRIKLYTVKAGDTYDKLAKSSPLADYRQERLRLLNGDYPDKPLKTGRLIKLIE
jgi:predicted Zn-dependent protease